jgi:hypothetical protein
MANEEAAMKDEMTPPANSPESLPALPAQRLQYVEPKLICFGDLAALTHAVGNNGKMDGGVNFGFMSSGI